MQVLDLTLILFRKGRMITREQRLQVIQCDPLPAAHLVHVHLIFAGNLADRPVAPDRREGGLGLG